MKIVKRLKNVVIVRDEQGQKLELTENRLLGRDVKDYDYTYLDADSNIYVQNKNCKIKRYPKISEDK